MAGKKKIKGLKYQKNWGGEREGAGKPDTGAEKPSKTLEIKLSTFELLSKEKEKTGKTWDLFLVSLVDTQATS